MHPKKVEKMYLVVGDIHLSHRRLKRSELLLKRITEKIAEYNPDTVVLLGDVFDEHDVVRNDCLTIFSEFLLSNKDTEIIHILGNHEMNDSKTFLPRFHSLTPFKQLQNYVVVDWPMIKECSNTIIGFIPYCPPGSFQTAVDMLAQKPHILFAHQEFKGCLMDGGLKSEHGDDIPDCKIISGHIHGEHTVANKVWYPGTPCQHRFSEEENKSIYLLSVKNGNYSIKQAIDLNMPKFITRQIDISDIGQFCPEPENEYRIVIKDTSFNIIAFKKTKEYKRLAKSVKFKFIAEDATQTVERKANTKSKTFTERFSDYVKERKLEESYKFIFDKLP